MHRKADAPNCDPVDILRDFHGTVVAAIPVIPMEIRVMELINKTFDCFIVGGPQHGVRVRLSCSGDAALYPTLMTNDGLVCTAVAFRRSATGHEMWLLMHPQASGAQLREEFSAMEDDEKPAQPARIPLSYRLTATC